MSNSIWLSYSEDHQELARRIRRLPARKHLARKIGAGEGASQIVEVRSGAVIPETNRPGLYFIEVNTAHGRRRFEHAQEISEEHEQSKAPDEVWVSMPISFLHWAEKDIPWITKDDQWTEIVLPASRSLAISEPAQEPSLESRRPASTISAEPQFDDYYELPSKEVLHRLQNTSLPHQDRRRFIIEAEAMDFGPQELGLLNDLLRDFIARYRESNVPEDLVAVNAAIRKCVATMSAEDALAYTARLLEAGPRASVAPEIELELAKMVLRKLTANPPKHPEYLPELAGRLFELACAYLNPRLLAREKYGAISINAVLGLVLLRGRNIGELFRLVSGLNVPWFLQLLTRRSGRLRDELRRRFPEEQLEELIDSLGNLEACIQASGK